MGIKSKKKFPKSFIGRRTVPVVYYERTGATIVALWINRSSSATAVHYFRSVNRGAVHPWNSRVWCAALYYTVSSRGNLHFRNTKARSVPGREVAAGRRMRGRDRRCSTVFGEIKTQIRRVPDGYGLR